MRMRTPLIIGYNFYHTNVEIVSGLSSFSNEVENIALAISFGNIGGIRSWCL